MIHRRRHYSHVQQIVGMAQILPFGIIHSGIFNLPPYSPMRACIRGNPSRKRISLPCLASGGEFQHIHRIISWTGRHRAAHALTGEILERKSTTHGNPVQMSDCPGHGPGTPGRLRLPIIPETSRLVLPCEPCIRHRDRILPEPGRIPS